MPAPLNMRKEAATKTLISLMKAEQAKGRDPGAVSARVYVALDFSRSMNDTQGYYGPPTFRYDHGEVQDVMERMLGLAVTGLDDEGTVPVFMFHDGVFPPFVANEQNYQGIIDRWRKGKSMGGTNYVPVMQAIVNHARQNGGLGPDTPPAFVLFGSDGVPHDQKQTLRFLVEAAKLPIFWQFLGFGHQLGFVRTLDTMGGRVVDNVGLISVSNTLKISDEQFYHGTVREYITSWLPAARRLGITRR